MNLVENCFVVINKKMGNMTSTYYVLPTRTDILAALPSGTSISDFALNEFNGKVRSVSLAPELRTVYVTGERELPVSVANDGKVNIEVLRDLLSYLHSTKNGMVISFACMCESDHNNSVDVLTSTNVPAPDKVGNDDEKKGIVGRVKDFLGGFDPNPSRYEVDGHIVQKNGKGETDFTDVMYEIDDLEVIKGAGCPCEE
jgi:hypothetical protein